MRNLSLVLLASVVISVVPAGVQAQAVQGKMRWGNGTTVGAGLGSSFGWWWKKNDGTARNVYGGGAYQGSFNITPSPSPSWMWPTSASGNLPSGGTAFGPAVDIYCVDFLHNANTGTGGYDAWFTKLTVASFAGGPTTVHTRSGDLTRYLKAAWLITQMKTAPTNYDRADIHAAIWQILSGEPAWTYKNSTSGYVAVGASNSTTNWITQASVYSNYSSINGDEWTVVTDQCVGSAGHTGSTTEAGYRAWDSCSQEFLTQNVVPEPATMILLGTGLLATLAVAGVFRRPEA